LSGLKQLVMPRTKNQVDMVYIRRIKMMSIPFKFRTMRQTTNEVALLDSGVTKNFLDEEVWR